MLFKLRVSIISKPIIVISYEKNILHIRGQVHSQTRPTNKQQLEKGVLNMSEASSRIYICSNKIKGELPAKERKENDCKSLVNLMLLIFYCPLLRSDRCSPRRNFILKESTSTYENALKKKFDKYTDFFLCMDRLDLQIFDILGFFQESSSPNFFLW